MSFPRDLGRVSAKYESGGRGVAFVSNGSAWGDPGGDSYGVHQLSGAYSMGAFLRSSWGKPYKSKFGSLKPGTKSFNSKYKQVADADPDGFGYAQKAFYATTHYIPVRDHAAKLGFDVTDRGIQEALFSMSVQHGGAKKIVSAAHSEGLPSHPSDQIKALYRERVDYVNGLRSLSCEIKRSLVNNRYKDELRDVLELVGEYEAGEVEHVKPSDTLQEDVGDSAQGMLLTLFKLLMSIVSAIFGGLKRAKDRVNESIVIPQDIDEAVIDEEVKAGKELPWMATAKRLMGTKEISGKRSNSVIMNWAKQLGGFVKNVYTNDDTPWCGLFIAHIFDNNGIKVKFKNPLSARNWRNFGFETTPRYGAVMIFWRGKKSGWSGHVGMYISEDAKYYHILGGNQSNMVNVTKVAKNRLLAVRFPNGYEGRVGDYHAITKKFDGKVSTNEA